MSVVAKERAVEAVTDAQHGAAACRRKGQAREHTGFSGLTSSASTPTLSQNPEPEDSRVLPHLCDLFEVLLITSVYILVFLVRYEKAGGGRRGESQTYLVVRLFA